MEFFFCLLADKVGYPFFDWGVAFTTARRTGLYLRSLMVKGGVR